MANERSMQVSNTESNNANDTVEKVNQAIRAMTATAPKGTALVKTSAQNPMLDTLVYGDNDLVGLVAYAMHEVNRRDWCTAYEAGNGRPPSENDVRAYLIGEQLERRLDTYRRLAEDSLAKVSLGDASFRRLSETNDLPRSGNPQVAQLAATTQPKTITPAPAQKSTLPQHKKGSMVKLVVYLALLLIAVIGFGLALRYGLDMVNPVK